MIICNPLPLRDIEETTRSRTGAGVMSRESGRVAYFVHAPPLTTLRYIIRNYTFALEIYFFKHNIIEMVNTSSLELILGVTI